MKPGHLISFIVVFVGAYFCAEQLKGSEGIPLQSAVILLLINAIIGFYLAFFEEADTNLIEVQTVCKALAPALYTTHLFVENSILGDLLDYLPFLITLIVACSSAFVEDEVSRQRYVKGMVLLNCVAQIYVAFQKGQDICLISQALILCTAYFAYIEGRLIFGLWNFAQYNYLSGIFLILLGKNCSS